MQNLLKLVSAVLILVAGMLIVDSAKESSGWPDQSAPVDQDAKPVPHPSPEPKPSPPLNPNHLPDLAQERAKLLGRPLVLYFQVSWCPPCQLVTSTMLPLMEQKGELGVVDVESTSGKRLYEQCAKSLPFPCVVLYKYDETAAGKWRVLIWYVGSDKIRDWLLPLGGETKAMPIGETEEIEGGKPKPEVDNRAALLVIYDGSQACLDVLPVLKEFEGLGFTVRYARADDPVNAKKFERFKVAEKGLPCFIMWKGHEAMEVWRGHVNLEGLTRWYRRIEEGQQSVGYEKPTMQSFLGKEDRPYLQTVKSPGSCGMYDCWVHGATVHLQAVDARGQPIPEVRSAPRVQIQGRTHSGPANATPSEWGTYSDCPTCR